MAERTIRQLIDDIDGSEITDGKGERIEFSIRSVTYQIDLSGPNSAKFDKALKPFVNAAQKLRGTSRRQPKNPGGKSSPEHLAAIRAWARKKGFEVSDRGRIRAEVVEAFDAAH